MIEKVLNQILDKIEKIYSDTSVNQIELSELWTEYYKISHNYNVKSDRAYQLYLLGENVSFINNTSIHYEKPDMELVTKAKNNLLTVIEENKEKLTSGITLEEAKLLLNYDLYSTWRNLSYLGIDIRNNSLNGFCELAQLTSIYPLEQLGLKVTKNEAGKCFGYLFNHIFGTVTFPIKDENNVHEITFLVDPTYKQFFSIVRCNEGRYYTREENTNILSSPDPGYFLTSPEEQEFSSNLIYNGYIELTENNAKIYGMGFQKASININEKNSGENLFDFNSNYVKSIINNTSNYKTTISELDDYGFDLDFFNISCKNK